MRQTTRRKYYGRSAITQALRSAANELGVAIIEAEKESPLAAQLQKVSKCLDNALGAEKIYALSRKRIRSHLEQERKHIQTLIAEVMDVPILPDEKVLAKRKKGGKPDGTNENRKKNS